MERTFSHHCFSNAEATAALAQGLAESKSYRRITYLCLALCLTAFGAFLLSVYLDHMSQLPTSACLFVAFAAGGGFIYRLDLGYGNVWCATTYLDPLDSDEKARVVELGETFPEIAKIVGCWLADGKELRRRDFWALRSYASELKRQEADSTLSEWRAGSTEAS